MTCIMGTTHAKVNGCVGRSFEAHERQTVTSTIVCCKRNVRDALLRLFGVRGLCFVFDVNPFSVPKTRSLLQRSRILPSRIACDRKERVVMETCTGIMRVTSKVKRVFNSLKVQAVRVFFFVQGEAFPRDICVADVASCPRGSALVA